MLDGLILVTGGAGFIGSALVWALNQRGIERIIIADFLRKDEKWKNLVPLRFHDYLEADRLLEKIQSGGWPEVRYVFHLGACSSTTEQDGRYLVENNYKYSCQLAEWALERNRRFVYASSAATYGDGHAGMQDGHEQLDDLMPLNMYGYSKHLFDKFAARQGWFDRIVGLKFFNIFGPNENHKGDMRSVVPKAVEDIQRDGQVRLFKSHRPDFLDGHQKRDFLYVKDAVEMTLHLAERPDAAGLFNVGSGVASTWIDLVTPIFHALQRPVKIEYVDMPASLRDKYQYYTCADVSRLRSTGWNRTPSRLGDAVTDYVSNYLVPDRRLGHAERLCPKNGDCAPPVATPISHPVYRDKC